MDKICSSGCSLLVPNLEQWNDLHDLTHLMTDDWREDKHVSSVIKNNEDTFKADYHSQETVK